MAPAAASSSAVSDASITEALATLSTSADVAALGGVAAIVRALGSDAKAGLTSDRAAANRAAFGANRLPHKLPRALWEHLVEAFEDGTLRILVASAVFSTLFGVFLSDNTADIIQGIAIMIAVVSVSGVNSFQNWSKDRAVESLNKIKADRPVQVVRDGKEVRGRAGRGGGGGGGSGNTTRGFCIPIPHARPTHPLNPHAPPDHHQHLRRCRGRRGGSGVGRRSPCGRPRAARL